MSQKITWHGHACFTIECNGYTIAIDPYDPAMVGYSPLHITANEVYASHGHHDHDYFDAVSLAIPERESPFFIRTVKSFHDDSEGAKRGENLIYIFECEEKDFVHLGDLGHPLTKAQTDVIGRCDVLMMPVGGFYTIDAKQAMDVAHQLNADVILPMHYRFDGHGPEVIAELSDFLDLADREIVRCNGNSIDIDDNIKRQIVVLKFLG